jgi:hypothetical protein
MSGIWNYLWRNPVKNNVEFEMIEIDKSTIKEILTKHLNSRTNQLKLLNIINASNRVDTPHIENKIIQCDRKIAEDIIKEKVLMELFPSLTPSDITICEIPQTFKDEYISAGINKKKMNKKRKKH